MGLLGKMKVCFIGSREGERGADGIDTASSCCIGVLILVLIILLVLVLIL